MKSGVKKGIIIAAIIGVVIVAIIASNLLPVTASLSVDKTSYAFGETLTLKGTVKNNGIAPKTYTFSTGCTAGSLFIDDQELVEVLLCTQSITNVTLSTFGSKTYDYAYTLVERAADQTYNLVNTEGKLEINSGDHSAYLIWEDAQSEPVTFSVSK